MLSHAGRQGSHSRKGLLQQQLGVLARIGGTDQTCAQLLRHVREGGDLKQYLLQALAMTIHTLQHGRQLSGLAVYGHIDDHPLGAQGHRLHVSQIRRNNVCIQNYKLQCCSTCQDCGSGDAACCATSWARCASETSCSCSFFVGRFRVTSLICQALRKHAKLKPCRSSRALYILLLPPLDQINLFVVRRHRCHHRCLTSYISAQLKLGQTLKDLT